MDIFVKNVYIFSLIEEYMTGFAKCSATAGKRRNQPTRPSKTGAADGPSKPHLTYAARLKLTIQPTAMSTD
jgi:hypothetical protein